jgi:hypothetical protein
MSSETARETLEQAMTLAREATNGWACYARTGKELTEIGRIHMALDALAALRAAPAPTDVVEDLVVALRSLAYAAMTSGGTKGPDVALKDAIRWATDALQKYDKLRAAPAPEGETAATGWSCHRATTCTRTCARRVMAPGVYRCPQRRTGRGRR